jgi:hypothetical protein
VEDPKIIGIRETRDTEIQTLIERLASLGVTIPAPKKAGFMRIWLDRQEEILTSLREHRKGGLPAISVMLSAIMKLPLDSQRMSCTQADLAELEGWQPSDVSRAFKLLAQLGAILLPKREGKSQTWEIDARLASRMNDEKREAAIRRQRAELSQWHAVQARKAAQKRTQHEDHGAIQDKRQPPLV